MLILLIGALLGVILGLLVGILLGARLTRGHYLYMVKMQQPPRQALPPQPRPRSRQLYRDEEPYY